MWTLRTSLLLQLIIAPVLTGAALLAAFHLGGVVALEVPFFAAVVCALWLAGARAGLIVVGLSSLTIAFFFLPPLYDFRASDVNIALELGGFVIVSLLVVSYARRFSKARDLLEAVFRSTGEGIIVFDPDGAVRLMNPAAEKMTGRMEAEARGKPFTEVFPVRDPETLASLTEDLPAGPNRARPPGGWKPKLLIHQNGAEALIEDAISPIFERERVAGFVLVFRDITQRHAYEQHLQHTDRLQSIGRLAAGIAHNFNNLLTGIIGNTDLAVSPLPGNHPARPLLENALAASERAANLTRQLLAYSGQGRFVSEQVDLSRMVSETAELIDATLPSAATVRLEPASTLPVEADRAQLQQVLMNLVANAGESLCDGRGTIRIRTGSETMEANSGKGPQPGNQAQPGTYTYLEVQDTGCGMDQATLSRIFEPFFTTKFLGRGLGLAAVHGIVRSYGGSVEVESWPGQGSKFRVLLPIASKESGSAPPRAASGSLQS